MKLLQKTLLTLTSALSIGNSVAQDLPTTEQTTPLTTEQKIAQCRPYLHRVEHRDDLIRQMFQTGLLDDCLYSMPPEELQQIWDIPVVQMNDDNYAGADIPSRLGFYIAYSRFGMSIRLNKDSINEVGTLFPEGHYPKFMPEPSLIEEADFSWGMRHNNFNWTVHRAKPNDQIQHGNQHIWVKDNRAIEPKAYMYGAIVSLGFYNIQRYVVPVPQIRGFATTDTIKIINNLKNN